MPDTSLQWMRVDSSCLLLHQEGNADPMRKAIAKSAFLKPNQFEIGTFRINKSWQPSAWIKDLPNCTQMTFGMDHSSMVHSSKSQTLIKFYSRQWSFHFDTLLCNNSFFNRWKSSTQQYNTGELSQIHASVHENNYFYQTKNWYIALAYKRTTKFKKNSI